MTFVVISTDGVLDVAPAPADLGAVDRTVGPEGADRVRLGVPGVIGHVNDCGHVNGMPRNVVGSCVLATLGAVQYPYAGPVVITGWRDAGEDSEITDLNRRDVAMVEAIHHDVLIALGLIQGTHSGGEAWAAAIREYAETVRTAPAPRLTFLDGGDVVAALDALGLGDA